MTDLERAVLDLEVDWSNRPQRDGRKGDAIAALGFTETNYYQVLARLAHDPEALAVAPATLRTIRDRVQRRGAVSDHRRIASSRGLDGRSGVTSTHHPREDPRTCGNRPGAWPTSKEST